LLYTLFFLLYLPLALACGLGAAGLPAIRPGWRRTVATSFLFPVLCVGVVGWFYVIARTVTWGHGVQFDLGRAVAFAVSATIIPAFATATTARLNKAHGASRSTVLRVSLFVLAAAPFAWFLYELIGYRLGTLERRERAVLTILNVTHVVTVVVVAEVLLMLWVTVAGKALPTLATKAEARPWLSGRRLALLVCLGIGWLAFGALQCAAATGDL
jgi:hypothetical protein